MKRIFILIFALTWAFLLQAQQQVWVFLTDKGNCVAEQLAEPTQFLSVKAIEKRKANQVAIDASDLPVAVEYLDILNIHSHKLLGTSRWLNAVAVEIDASCIEELEQLSFVSGLRPIKSMTIADAGTSSDEGPIEPSYPRYVDADAPFDYGEAKLQNEMLNIVPLHARGLTGKGVHIALFDAGFSGADTIDVFDSLWADNRIGGYYDYFDNEEQIFNDHSHGTQVMSTIAANQPGTMVGMAPHATFFMFRTEDGATEPKRDELTWVRALEMVDSLGIDIVHSSLGYYDFDNPNDSYTYDEMDGNTTVISLAADKAAAKGLIICTSAGNEGNNRWKYITTPCDADSVLCVGAINKYQSLARFSSIGPSADGQIKPDVVALGSRTVIASPRNYVSKGDGTSYSAPLVAGLLACLKQAHPERSNMDIIQAVRMSADQAPFPDNEYGYGIPDAVIADSLLTHAKDLSKVIRNDIADKPARGRRKPNQVTQKPQPTKPFFATNPQSNVVRNGDILEINTPSTIREVHLMRGKQKVLLNPKYVTVDSKSARLDMSVLMEGEHFIYIKTTQYEENVKIGD